MQNIPFNIIIKKQIQEEIRKTLRDYDLNVDTVSRPESLSLESENVLSNVPTYQMMFPALESILRYRLVSGGEPVKMGQNTVYVHPAMAYFDDLNEPVITDGTFVEIPSYSEDRWVWVYLQEDGTFTANKYPPNIGDNVYRIAICKVWKEKGSDDFDERTLRDIRNVGFASANLNHLLRQMFLNLFLSIPKVQLYDISVTSYDAGDGKLYVKVEGLYPSVLYARLTPVKDSTVEIPRPESGTKHYFLLISAQVDNTDPDDLKWGFKVKEITEIIEPQEYPIAIIYNVSDSTTVISDDDIQVVGVQKTYKDNYIYTRAKTFYIEGNDTDFTVSNDYLYVPYLNTIITVIVNKDNTIDEVKLLIEGKGGDREYDLLEEVNYLQVRLFPTDKIKVKARMVSGETAGNINLELFISSQI